MEKDLLSGRMFKPISISRYTSSSYFKKNIIVEIICILFILLFVYAAISKLMEYQKFKVQLGQSPLLTSFANLISWLIPLIEIVISILLVFPNLRIFGLYCSFSLMTVFSAYIIAITKFSTYIPCSCGGILQQMSWNQHLIFNLFYLMLGLLGIIITCKNHQMAETSINANK